MDISQSALAWLYACACLLGAFLGAVYDCLRITRVFLGVHYSRRASKRLTALSLPLLPKRKKRTESRALGTVVFFEDLFFCIFAGVCIILLFYQLNNGKFRFPVLLSAGTGFLLYRQTLGRCVMLFSEVIAFAIECAVRYAVFFLLFPFCALLRWGRKKMGAAVSHTLYSRRRHVRRKFTEAEARRAALTACGMVPEEQQKARLLKRGERIAKGKETVQPDAADARSFGSARSGVGGRIRQ